MFKNQNRTIPNRRDVEILVNKKQNLKKKKKRKKSPKRHRARQKLPLEGSLSPKVEIPRWSGLTKRGPPPSNRNGWIGFQNVSRGLERGERERKREREHLDDCVRWKGRGTGVRRGCVHGLTIGNQTPFNALPSLQRVGARSFFRIRRRIPSIFRSRRTTYIG